MTGRYDGIHLGCGEKQIPGWFDVDALDYDHVDRIEDLSFNPDNSAQPIYDFHGLIFDKPSLSEALKKAGFSETCLWDWRTTEHAHLDDYSQAYIPHMDKENGTLVSLNIEAVK